MKDTANSRRARVLAVALALSVYAGLLGAVDKTLVEAANDGDVARVRALISSGENLEAKVASGTTALIAASQKGKIEVVRVLLKAKANPNAIARGGVTALYQSSQFGYLDVVQALLAAGANVPLP